MAWTLARWVTAVGAIACGLLALNHAFFSVWQTSAPPGNEYPEAWAHQAYRSFGYSVAFLAAAVLVVINLRRGWPHLRSKWTALVLIVAVVGVVLPRAQHFLEVDNCLDHGGRWDHMSQTCEQ